VTVGPQEDDGFTPGILFDQVGVKGADGSVPGLYALVQSNVEDMLKATYVQGNPKIDDPLESMYTDLREGVSLTLALFEKIVQGIIGQPSQLFLNIDHANTFLTLFIGGLNNQLTEHTEAITTLEQITAAMGTTVAYVGDLQDMVTVARSQLVSIGPYGAKSVDVVNPFSVLDLNFGFTMPAHKPTITLGSSTGTIYYTPVVVDRVGTVDRIRWFAGADTSIFSIDYYEIALCAYNPSNGNIEKVWGSGNIKDGVANTTTLSEVEIPMGINQTTTPGQILFVAHQQVAPGLFQAARMFAAAPYGKIGRPNNLLLNAACYTRPGNTQGIPSSIPLSILTKENRFIPWAAVSVVTT
jgi:hypothetical protein